MAAADAQDETGGRADRMQGDPTNGALLFINLVIASGVGAHKAGFTVRALSQCLGGVLEKSNDLVLRKTQAPRLLSFL